MLIYCLLFRSFRAAFFAEVGVVEARIDTAGLIDVKSEYLSDIEVLCICSRIKRSIEWDVEICQLKLSVSTSANHSWTLYRNISGKPSTLCWLMNLKASRLHILTDVDSCRVENLPPTIAENSIASHNHTGNLFWQTGVTQPALPCHPWGLFKRSPFISLQRRPVNSAL